MSFQDPATHARARQQAGFRYEAARRQLAQTMHERSDWHAQVHGHGRQSLEREVAARRAVVVEAVPLYGMLTRYVRRSLDDSVNRGDIDPFSVVVEDIVEATYLAAIEAIHAAAPPAAVFPWLRRLAREEVRLAVAHAADREHLEASLDTLVPTADDPDWPPEVLHLIDVLAAPDAPIPEEVFEDDESRRRLDRLLALLPERWREVLLLNAVDGWADREIARVEGLAVEDVRPIVDASRAFLRAWLDAAAHDVA